MKCAHQYSDAESVCPNCGEPFRMNALPVNPAGEEVTGKAIRIGSRARPFHRAVSVQLKIPGLVIAAVFVVVLAAGVSILKLLFGWLVKR